MLGCLGSSQLSVINRVRKKKKLVIITNPNPNLTPNPIPNPKVDNYRDAKPYTPY